MKTMRFPLIIFPFPLSIYNSRMDGGVAGGRLAGALLRLSGVGHFLRPTPCRRNGKTRSMFRAWQWVPLRG
jgi:hypothetical protein